MGATSSGFANLFSVHLEGNETAGGTVAYTITADDGGTQVATEHGTIQWLAKNNTITCTISPDDQLHIATVDGGCVPGFYSPGTQPGVGIFDNIAFTTPAPVVHHTVVFTVINNSNAAVRLEP